MYIFGNIFFCIGLFPPYQLKLVWLRVLTMPVEVNFGGGGPGHSCSVLCCVRLNTWPQPPSPLQGNFLCLTIDRAL